IAGNHSNLGIVYAALGHYEKAARSYKKALEISMATEGGMSLNTANYLNNLGLVFTNMGVYEKAIQYYEKSLEIKLLNMAEEHPFVAMTYDNMGIVYDKLGQYEKAIPYYEKALEIRKKAFDEFHPSIGRSYNNLGIVHKNIGNFDQSVRYHEEAVKIKKKVLGEDHPVTSSSYHNLGFVHAKMGHSDTAVYYYEKAISSLLKSHGDTHPEVAVSYYNLGEFYRGQKQFEEALVHYDKAFDAINFAGLDNLGQVNFLPLLIDNFYSIGSLYGAYHSVSGDMSHLYLSKSYLDKAVQLIDEVARSPVDHLTWLSGEKTFLIYNSGLLTNFELFENTDSSKYLEESFILSERSKSFRLYRAMLESKARSFGGVPQDLLSKENEIRTGIALCDKQRYEKVAEGFSQTDTTVLAIASRRFDLEREYEHLKVQFEQDYPEYYRLKYGLKTVALKELQSGHLGDQETVLEYFIGETAIFIFLLKADDFRIVRVEKDLPMDLVVQQFREGLLHYHRLPYDHPDQGNNDLLLQMRQQYITSARKLYDLLLAPVADQLTSSLIIIPDRILGNVPFEALLTEDVQNPGNFAKYPYLLHKHQVNYSYSATLLREMQQKQHHDPPSNDVLALAPFYEKGYQHLEDQIRGVSFLGSKDSSVTILSKRIFTVLPASGEEVGLITKAWGGESQYLLGPDATEESFNQLAGDYRILHLSTHGVADNRAGDYSYLAFAEIPDSLENELLYVRELYSRDLNADLVVLSACETNIGELRRGEGIISMARAFAYAGAKSIVTSLWSVNDGSTKDLIVEFYGFLKEGKTKGEALHAAKLAYLTANKGARNHPYYWAGFIPIGDMSPLN
ncbi:MAG: CHAT domain-containing tetratricopeptide repeat protein, partial [Bacteroidota bacterium]